MKKKFFQTIEMCKEKKKNCQKSEKDKKKILSSYTVNLHSKFSVINKIHDGLSKYQYF